MAAADDRGRRVSPGITFRVFVSSTFRDFAVERSVLQERVWPRLRELCLRHGARFQAIDLRWGVSEDAAQDQRAMAICLEEIRRCQQVTPRPNFVVLLGNRYGWRPPPATIPQAEFEAIGEHIPDPDARALTDQWYSLDANSVPPECCLRGRGEMPHEEWLAIEERLHRVLLDGARMAGLSGEAMVKFERSATEQEIIAGALEADLRNAFAYYRDVEGLPEDQSAAEFIDLHDGVPDAEATALLHDLRERLQRHLPPEHQHTVAARWDGNGLSDEHVDGFCQQVHDDLARVILEEIEKLEAVDELEQEVRAHAEFGADRRRHFTGRREIIARVLDYVEHSGAHPLIIHGRSGSGKSALMAQVLGELPRDATVIARFIGATPASTQLHSLLRGLCEQIHREFGFAALGEQWPEEQRSDPRSEGERPPENPYEVPDDPGELAGAFEHFLGLLPEGRRLVILLDALDQLSPESNAHALHWLPRELPANVRIVASAVEDEGPAGQCCRSARSRLHDQALVGLPELTPDESEAILDVWLAEAGRTLQPEQRADVLGKLRACPEGHALFLRLAFEEARRWRSFDGLPAGADAQPGLSAGVAGVIADLLTRLEAPANHGRVLVERALGYLQTARNGLAEDELLQVLSSDDEVMADFRERSPFSPQVAQMPPVVWSRLFFDLRPYLTERAADGTSLLSLYHRQVGAAVEARYLGDRRKRSAVHRRLSRYFGGDLDRIDQPSCLAGEGGVRVPNRRKLSELPWQLARSGQWARLRRELTDLEFIEAACRAGEAHDLLRWFEAHAAQASDDVDLHGVAAWLSRWAGFMTRFPELVWQVAVNRGEDATVLEAAERYHPPLPPGRGWLLCANRGGARTEPAQQPAPLPVEAQRVDATTRRLEIVAEAPAAAVEGDSRADVEACVLGLDWSGTLTCYSAAHGGIIAQAPGLSSFATDGTVVFAVGDRQVLTLSVPELATLGGTPVQMVGEPGTTPPTDDALARHLEAVALPVLPDGRRVGALRMRERPFGYRFFDLETWALLDLAELVPADIARLALPGDDGVAEVSTRGTHLMLRGDGFRLIVDIAAGRAVRKLPEDRSAYAEYEAAPDLGHFLHIAQGRRQGHVVSRVASMGSRERWLWRDTTHSRRATFSARGEHILIGDTEGTVEVARLADTDDRAIHSFGRSEVVAMAGDEAAGVLAVATEDGRVQIVRGDLMAAGRQPARACCIGAARRWFAAAAGDSVYLWRHGGRFGGRAGLEEEPLGMKSTPDGSLLLALGMKEISGVDPARARLRWQSGGGIDFPWLAFASPDSRSVSVYSYVYSDVLSWDARTGARLDEPAVPALWPLLGATWSPDFRHAAWIDRERERVVLWPWQADGMLSAPLPDVVDAAECDVRAVADGGRWVLISDGLSYLLDMLDGSARPCPVADVEYAVVAPDGGFVALAHEDLVWCWDSDSDTVYGPHGCVDEVGDLSLDETWRRALALTLVNPPDLHLLAPAGRRPAPRGPGDRLMPEGEGQVRGRSGRLAGPVSWAGGLALGAAAFLGLHSFGLSLLGLVLGRNVIASVMMPRGSWRVEVPSAALGAVVAAVPFALGAPGWLAALLGFVGYGAVKGLQTRRQIMSEMYARVSAAEEDEMREEGTRSLDAMDPVPPRLEPPRAHAASIFDFEAATTEDDRRRLVRDVADRCEELTGGGRAEQAVALADEAMAYGLDDEWLWLVRLRALVALERWGDCMAALEDRMASLPQRRRDASAADRPDVCTEPLTWARVCTELGRYEEALAHIADMERGRDDEQPVSRLLRGRCALGLRDPHEALAHLRAAATDLPFSPEAHLWLGACHAALGDATEAERELEEARLLGADEAAVTRARGLGAG